MSEAEEQTTGREGDNAAPAQSARLTDLSAEAVLSILVAKRARDHAHQVATGRASFLDAVAIVVADAVALSDPFDPVCDFERVAQNALDDALRLEDAEHEHSAFLLYDLASRLRTDGLPEERARAWLARAAQRVPWPLSVDEAERIVDHVWSHDPSAPNHEEIE